ncbi:Zinc finger CCCH domain protein [Melia azedarach]|uniref:Zinc finger CCCH domain protein n=1 Tax=Melia azedarach TaxID=155640 RepID=A0ACC1WYD9_MELAZ|nr:Zinc finger CCCH domain protein [Melia azedarach]
MSVEEREKHLARRRRNYQLRRLRAENSKLDSEQTQSEQITHQILALPSASSDLDVDVGSHQVGTKFESLEVPPHKLAKFSGQLRLNRLKHLARSMNDSAGDKHGVAVDVIKGNEASGILPKGLRLNRVKHLARSLNSAVKETTNQNHSGQVEG